MKSLIIKRSVVVAGHKTSVSLEDAFWRGLKEVAGERDTTLSELVGTIDSEREYGNLSSALRLFVLDFYRTQLSDLKEGRGCRPESGWNFVARSPALQGYPIADLPSKRILGRESELVGSSLVSFWEVAVGLVLPILVRVMPIRRRYR